MGLLVGVTALALLLGTLVGLVLRSRRQAVAHLKTQMVRRGPDGGRGRHLGSASAGGCAWAAQRGVRPGCAAAMRGRLRPCAVSRVRGRGAQELNADLAAAKEEAESGRRVLQKEKEVMDVLIQRQRNLLELFGKEDELLAASVDSETADMARRRLQLGADSSMSSRASRGSPMGERGGGRGERGPGSRAARGAQGCRAVG